MAEVAPSKHSRATEAAVELLKEAVFDETGRFASGTIFIPADTSHAATSVARAREEGKPVAVVFPDGTAVVATEILALGNSIAEPHASFVIYADDSGRYRWKLLSATGETTASSAETFATEAEAARAAAAVKLGAAAADVPAAA
jgi:uncharacterized protein YegP (UPF0339 family)